MNPPRRSPRLRFALLLVFAMAANRGDHALPRAARASFEAERAREEVLIRRGEEYKHAIKLFLPQVSSAIRPPSSAREHQHIRFLRQRYKDPMTGKDEWRLIHAGPAASSTDSLTRSRRSSLSRTRTA